MKIKNERAETPGIDCTICGRRVEQEEISFPVHIDCLKREIR